MPSGIFGLANEAIEPPPILRVGGNTIGPTMHFFNSTSPAVNQPACPPATPTRPRKKRNRALKRQRRKISLFQQELHAKAEVLHDHVDQLQEDDPEARFDRDVHTTSVHRIRALEMERIGHT